MKRQATGKTFSIRTWSAGTKARTGNDTALFNRDLRYVIGEVKHYDLDAPSQGGKQVHNRTHVAAGIVTVAIISLLASVVLGNHFNSATDSSIAVASAPQVESTGPSSVTPSDAVASRANPTDIADTDVAQAAAPAPLETDRDTIAVSFHDPDPVSDGTVVTPAFAETASASENTPLISPPGAIEAVHVDIHESAPAPAIGGAGLFDAARIEALFPARSDPDDSPTDDAVVNSLLPRAADSAAENTAQEQTGSDRWQKVTVQRGDTLTEIFQRFGFNAADAIRLVGEKAARPLKSLIPDATMELMASPVGTFGGLRYELTPEKILEVETTSDQFIVNEVKRDFDIRLREATGTINSSLFESAIAAGLNDNIIMQMASIFAYQIDFALDIREGDHYAVIFEERWIDDRMVGTGEIVAAEFVNDGTPYRAIRHMEESGLAVYYDPDGRSLKRTFLRSPLSFTRITSGFSKRRFHPILKKWRAHKGVDYGAARGTPIMATADGIIVKRGTNGGYGKTIVIKHGDRYRTLYAHMSRYRKGLKVGSRVKQGQTIGYVGRTGWATGSHLHYEFRIDGQHRNPLTVKLPRSLKIEKRHLHAFLDEASIWGARLDSLRERLAANDDIDVTPLPENS